MEPYRVEATTDYPSLVGKYTFRSSTKTITSSSVYYIVGVSGSRMYYIQLSNSQDLESADTLYTFSDSIIDDGTGKYILDTDTIKNVKKSEWVNDYANYKGKYYCLDDTCTNIYQLTSTTRTDFTYVNIANDYMYGNTFTYNEETEEYTLSGETQHFYDWPNNYSKLSNTHYTCWNTSGTCKTLSYIYYINSGTPYYINLEKGTSVEMALDEMLYGENVNTTNSTIKNVIDVWYSKNMTEYTDYLEDTVWCNDRSMNNQSTNGWNPNGGSNSTHLRFRSYSNGSSLTCPNKIDRFTVKGDNGNGALTYPVGLVTEPERALAYYSSNSPLSSGNTNWSLSPNYFNDRYAFGYRVTGDGYNFGYGTYVGYSYGVRPAVSLRTGIESLSGDETADYPYVIDMDADHNKYSITFDKNDDFYISYDYAYKGQTIEIKSKVDDKRVRAFKLNGKLVKGNKFVMPGEDVTITDVDYGSLYFNINIEGNDDIISSPSTAKEGEEVSLDSKSGYFKVTSFKINGKLMNDYSFEMPGEDVIITDVTVVPGTIIESEHNPYPNSLNKVYGERTFDGAISLTVELDYQTESTSYDWIYLYDSTGKQYGKYGGTTRKTETITIPGDYLKVVFRTDSSGNNYYGFKATITPNYD